MISSLRQPDCGARHRVVLDDHRRLPGRFFGRFTTAIAAALSRVA